MWKFTSAENPYRLLVTGIGMVKHDMILKCAEKVCCS